MHGRRRAISILTLWRLPFLVPAILALPRRPTPETGDRKGPCQLSPVSSLCEPHARQLHRRLAALVSTPRSSGRRPESWTIGRTPPPATRAISLEAREPVQMEGGLLEREADHPKHAIPRNEVSQPQPEARMRR